MVHTRMHELDLLVRELREGQEQLRQVGAHVCVRTIPYRQLGVLHNRENVGWLFWTSGQHNWLRWRPLYHIMQRKTAADCAHCTCGTTNT